MREQRPPGQIPSKHWRVSFIASDPIGPHPMLLLVWLGRKRKLACEALLPPRKPHLLRHTHSKYQGSRSL